MRHSTRHAVLGLSALATVLGIEFLSLSVERQGYSLERFRAWSASVGSPAVFESAPGPTEPDTLEYRIARRLQHRLRMGGQPSPALDLLAQAVSERQHLLRKRTRVIFSTEESAEHAVWDITASRYPVWIQPAFSFTAARFHISPIEILKSLRQDNVVSVLPPQDAFFTSIVKTSADGPLRGAIDGLAKPGYRLDTYGAVSAILLAFQTDQPDVAVALTRVNGRIINRTDLNLGDLVLLSTGQSNFRGSPAARSANVRKALREHVNNVIVPPGGTFSFVETLEGPVSESNGWRLAKVIFNGDELRLAPGGGICQASTTVYRAIINAGLPVLERRSHSLYVSYYKQYGVGIDATVFPGSQDLKFLNDTGNFIVVQSYDDGYDAYTSLYGTPDGRAVELNGPFFARTAPPELQFKGRSIGMREIAWTQRVRFPDGTVQDNVILSAYKELPAGLSSEYALESWEGR